MKNDAWLANTDADSAKRSKNDEAEDSSRELTRALFDDRPAVPARRPSGRFQLPQVLMDEGNRHAAFANRGGDPFHRAEPDIAAREDAGRARLQQVRVTLELPVSGAAQIAAGAHVALRVEGDLRREPAGLG